MPENKNTSPVSPCTSSEFLDYVIKVAGKQVDAYKRLAGGIGRSSYTIEYYAHSDTFHMFVDIIGEFEEMTRSEFLAFHGTNDRIWYIHYSPTPKPENVNSTLIAICEESPDVPADLRRMLTGKQIRIRCADCRISLSLPKKPAQITPLCDGCSSKYVEGSEFYGVLCKCGGAKLMDAAGSYKTLSQALECVRALDKMGYDCRMYKGLEPQKYAVELRLWIPLMRIFPEEGGAVCAPAETPIHVEK